MRDERVDPIVRRLTFSERRAELVERCRRLDAELAGLDRRLDELSARRRTLVDERVRAHRSLHPVLNRKGRQALPDGSAALPPLPADPIWLEGRRLRVVCVGVLARRGELPLVELHAQLHRLGFGIDHPEPVKALADALRYELLHGRVRRVGRGVYGVGRTGGRAEQLATELLAAARGQW